MQNNHAQTNQVVPFFFQEYEVRVITDEAGIFWFIAADVCAALDLGNTTNALKRLDDEEKTLILIKGISRGNDSVNVINESGLYSLILNCRKPEAKPFKKWVTSEVLPTIRKTGGYELPKSKRNTLIDQESRALKMFPLAHRAAKILGLDKNETVLSANKAVINATGISPLRMLGHDAILSESQEHWHKATDIGELIGRSAQAVNKLLESCGLQYKLLDKWTPTESGKEYSRLFDTGKKHGDGTAVTQLKWKVDIVPVLLEEIARQPIPDTLKVKHLEVVQ
jgi:prophage antirepressor-like protein